MSSGTTLDAELLFWLRQHRGRWAVFSAAFHHTERAPRVTSSLTAEAPTIRSFSTILGVDIRILATRVRRARTTRKCHEMHAREMHAREMHAREMHVREMHVREVHA